MEITDFSSRNRNNIETDFSETIQSAGIPLPYFIPKTKKNHYFYKNGLSHIIPRLKVKVHTEIEECYELWNKFSTNKSLFDLWDLRYAWYKGYQCKTFFYTIYENSVPLVVLPLWFDEDTKRYEWFGSWWMEDHVFFAKDQKLIDLLFTIVPKPIFLNSIEFVSPVEEIKDKRFFSILQKDDPKNIKDISSYKTINDYLEGLRKKSRYNLKADYNRIKSLKPKVVITEGYNEKSFEKLVFMNTNRFDGIKKERSDFFDLGTQNAIRNTIKDAELYKTKFIEVYIQKKLAAIDLIAEYKGVYYTLLGGNDVDRFKGIGNYLVYLEFQDAIRNKFKMIDCFQIDYGWKHRYFDQREVYKLAM